MKWFLMLGIVGVSLNSLATVISPVVDRSQIQLRVRIHDLSR